MPLIMLLTKRLRSRELYSLFLSTDSDVPVYCLCSLVVNVMQRDSIPSEVDYETRQGVYSICLQLARFKMPHELTHIHKDGYSVKSSILKLAVFTGSFWLVRACLQHWMMMSSEMARRCHPVRFVMQEEQGGSCLSVELQRSPPTGRCLCLSARP